jgi:hypothetical protein
MDIVSLPAILPAIKRLKVLYRSPVTTSQALKGSAIELLDDNILSTSHFSVVVFLFENTFALDALEFTSHYFFLIIE